MSAPTSDPAPAPAAPATPAQYRIADDRFRPLILGNATLAVLGEGFAWTEGPVWFADHDCLYFSDIPNDRVMRWSAADGCSVHRAPAGFPNGHARDCAGRLVSCLHGARAVVRREPDGSATVLAERHAGKRLNSPNDVACTRDGAIWFTDPTYGIETDYEGHKAESEQPPALYRLAPDGTLRAMAADFVGPNGLAFSPDETVLYVSETGRQFDADPVRFIRRFTVGADGALAGGGEWARISPGYADGLCVDAAGHVWTGGGDGVHCLAPDGALLGVILTPAPVANLCFGGATRTRLFLCAGQQLLTVPVNVAGALRP